MLEGLLIVLLAIVFAFDKFRFYLLGSKVVVHSNHATLKFLKMLSLD